jgi:hypothetical protein
VKKFVSDLQTVCVWISSHTPVFSTNVYYWWIIHTIEHSSHFHPYKYSPDNDWCIPKYTEHLYEPWLGQIKDYEIGICCFSVKHAALRSKSKHWLHRNQNNVWEWSDMSTHRLLFQWARIISIKTQLEVWWSRTKWTSSSFHWM